MIFVCAFIRSHRTARIIKQIKSKVVSLSEMSRISIHKKLPLFSENIQYIFCNGCMMEHNFKGYFIFKIDKVNISDNFKY